jgi:hypothetical protein
MPATVDLKDAIKSTLYANWTLHGQLARDKVNINTGVPAGSRSYPSIEILDSTSPNKVMSGEWLERQPHLYVHVFLRPNTYEQDAIDKAKVLKRKLVEEVTKILWANNSNVIDTSWVHPLDSINADQFTALDDDAGDAQRSSAAESRGDFYPILHEIIPVEAKRYFSARIGGVQTNR